MASPKPMPEGFAESAKTMGVKPLAKKFGIHPRTALRMVQELGLYQPRQKKALPDDVEDMAQGRSVADLARHYGWNRDTMRASLRRYRPDLLAKCVAVGDEVKRQGGRERMQKANAVRLVQRRRSSGKNNVLNFDREKLLAQVTRAMRHLQRQRLGPCYPWKDGYYWMGKCLDEAALMAEAERRGWNER